MKYILYKSSYLRKTKVWQVQITDQSHIKSEFGADSDDMISFTSKNGLRLSSLSHPQVDEKHQTIYVLGSNSSVLKDTLYMDSVLYKRFVFAVKEYNAHFSDKKTAPRATSLSVFGDLGQKANVILRVKDGWPTVIKSRKTLREGGIPDGIYYSFPQVSKE